MWLRPQWTPSAPAGWHTHTHRQAEGFLTTTMAALCCVLLCGCGRGWLKLHHHHQTAANTLGEVSKQYNEVVSCFLQVWKMTHTPHTTAAGWKQKNVMFKQSVQWFEDSLIQKIKNAVIIQLLNINVITAGNLKFWHKIRVGSMCKNRTINYLQTLSLAAVSNERAY